MKNYSNEEIYERRQKRQSIIEKIKLIVVIMIAIIVIYNISLIYQSLLNPNKTPSFLGTKTFAIISGSMIPKINVGDIVLVKEIEENELQEGDIITYRKNNEMITHRIQKIETEEEQKKYITKGDNNNVEDATSVIYEDIEGKVVKIIPYFGYIVIFLKNKLVLLLIMLIFFILYSMDMKEQNKKMMRERKKEILNTRRD